MVQQRFRTHAFTDRRTRLYRPRYHQRRFRESVARIKRLATKTARLKRGGKSFERLDADRLGAVERDSPTAQVECRALFGVRLAHAQLVREVWCTARRR